jgi:hypothetical protein
MSGKPGPPHQFSCQRRRLCVMRLMRNDLWVLLTVVGLIVAILWVFYILATLT